MKFSPDRVVKHARHAFSGARAAKMPTKRSASRFVQWMLWSQDNFKRVALVTVVVVAVATGYFAIPATMRVQQATYDAQLAAYNQQQADKAKAAAEKVAAAATTAVGTPTFLPVPGAAPVAKDAESKEAWSPLGPTPTATVDPTAAVDAAATGFLTAWASGATQKSRTTWIAAMRPHATDGMLDNFRSVDPTAMPKDLTVTVVDSTIESSRAVTTAQAGPYGDVKLELEKDDNGKWRVASLLPAHSD